MLSLIKYTIGLLCTTIENSSTQAANSDEKSSIPLAGEDLLKKATADQHWLAIGHDYNDEAASVGRSVSNGMLIKLRCR